MPRAGLEPAEESRSSQVLVGIAADSEASEANISDPLGPSAESAVTCHTTPSANGSRPLTPAPRRSMTAPALPGRRGQGFTSSDTLSRW